MVYLRLGWLVGNAGLLGAIAILLAAYIITGTTALSLSSISTNLHVRSGGAFAIIAQALGLEAGGAIGIPLYLAQTLSSALYLYAFTEAWAMMFPEHNPMIVVAIAFMGVATLAWTSTSLAFTAQAMMMMVVGVALSSALMGWFFTPTIAPNLLGNLPEASLGESFAIFFPAATGIMVGVGMSGELKNPTKSIPRGTIGAWAISLIVYLVFAFWYATVASSDELLKNPAIVFDYAIVGWIVLLGLLASTLMAALSTLVSAPRLLCAMAEHGVVPGHNWLSQRSPSSLEPTKAILVTLFIAGLGLLSGSLNAIAPVITSFFIVTYLALNGVVLLEQRLAMISFRPTLSAPPWVPAIGVITCMIALVGTSFGGGIVELILISAIYIGLMGRQLKTPWETVHSGLVIRVAHWIAQRVAHTERSERAWKPDLLLPVRNVRELEEFKPILTRLGQSGTIKIVGTKSDLKLERELQRTVNTLRQDHIYTSSTVIDLDESFHQIVQTTIDATRGAMFPPNIVVLVDSPELTNESIQTLVRHCQLRQLALILFLKPNTSNVYSEIDDVAVWLSDRSPDWALRLHQANLDLPLLLAYLLTRQNNGRIHLHTVVPEQSTGAARGFLSRVKSAARLPGSTSIGVHNGSFLKAVSSQQRIPLHLFGLPAEVKIERLRAIRAETYGAGVLFVMDSGYESALA